jgi:hypothetical protein
MIKTGTAGILRARPDHTFARFVTPDRSRFAVTLQALIDYLRQKGHTLRFTPLPPAPVIADLSPLHKEFQAISSLINSQVLALDDRGNFNPTSPVSPADVIYALKKILNAIEN